MTAPISASTSAIATNRVCRPGWRDEDGAGGAANSRPPVMDLPNKRFRLSFIWPAWFLRNHSKFLAGTGLQLRHGYRTPCAPVVLGYDPENCGRPSWWSD